MLDDVGDPTRAPKETPRWTVNFGALFLSKVSFREINAPSATLSLYEDVPESSFLRSSLKPTIAGASGKSAYTCVAFTLPTLPGRGAFPDVLVQTTYDHGTVL